MEQIFIVKIANGARLEVRADADLGLKPGKICVFHRDFFDDLGTVCHQVVPKEDCENAPAAERPQVLREATPNDLEGADANADREPAAMRTAKEWVTNLALPMKLINAHYSLDGKLLTIQFSADGRVDFRELVKELSRALGTRIELRQIGVRDEAGIYGGIAVCGQELCCCRFLREFSSINVKMAKEQDLSLTPATISGVCGRLKCCLKYEHAGYQKLEKGMPRKGEYCDTPSGRGKVTDRNLLTGRITVAFEGGSTAHFRADEVTVLRGEKRPQPSGNANSNGGSSRKNSERRERRNKERPAAGSGDGAATGHAD